MSHGPEHSKTAFKRPVRSFWYLPDTQGSFWANVRAVRSFSLLTNRKQWKMYSSVVRFGPHTLDRPKKFTNGNPLMYGSRKPIHVYIVLVIPTSCAISKTAVFFLRKSRSVVCVFCRTHHSYMQYIKNMYTILTKRLSAKQFVPWKRERKTLT